MTKEDYLKECLQKKEEAYNTLLSDVNNKEFMKAYESAKDKVEEARIDLKLEQREVSKIQKQEEKESKVEVSEAVKFVEGLRRAAEAGSTYQALVPKEISSQITKRRQELARLRGYCTVHKASGDYSIAVEGEGVSVNYIGENTEITDSTPTYNTVELKAYKLAALVRMSSEMIKDMAVDVVGDFVERCAKGFAETEDREILKGTGSTFNHMTGVITAVNGATTPKVVTQTTAGKIDFDEVKTVIDKLGKYAEGAIVVMNRATAHAISVLKDGNKYIFDPNLPLSQVYGCKVVITDQLDNLDVSGGVSMIAGNFSYYHIADRQEFNVRTLEERYAEFDQIGLRAIERLDGNVSITDAFCLFKNA